MVSSVFGDLAQPHVDGVEALSVRHVEDNEEHLTVFVELIPHVNIRRVPAQIPGSHLHKAFLWNFELLVVKV